MKAHLARLEKVDLRKGWPRAAKNKKPSGGIAIKKGSDWFINQDKNYDWGKVERGDWGEWKTLELDA